MQTQSIVPQRLTKAAGDINGIRPATHTVNYYSATWERWFPADADLAAIGQEFGSRISRGDFFELGRAAIADNSLIRRFAMAVMIWGYGTGGRGPTRTAAMLSHPEAVKRLVRGADLVLDGQLKDACLYFRDPGRGKLDQFSWSFFTKFFYFVGVAGDVSPMPLILDGSDRDRGVAGAMKRIADDGDADAARCMSLWWSTNDVQCAMGYALYVELMNGWAAALGCRPDAIEMAMFQGL